MEFSVPISRESSAVTEYIALKSVLAGKAVLVAAGLLAAIAAPAVLGESNASAQHQNETAPDATAPAQAVPAWQTAAGGKMTFEVASVKLSKPDVQQHSSFSLNVDDSSSQNGGLVTANLPLVDYIKFAYKLWLTRDQRQAMLAHLPKWVAADRFEIQARAEGDPTNDQLRLMMQSLLADR